MIYSETADAKFVAVLPCVRLALRQEQRNSMVLDAEMLVQASPLNCETELNEFCETGWNMMKLT